MLIAQYYSKKNFSCFESWRGFLAIVVSLAHCIQIFIFPHVGVNSLGSLIVGSIANFAVVIFFLISGILVSYSGIQLVKNNEFDFLGFFKNRFTRIYPPLIFMLFLVVVLEWLHLYINGTNVIVQLNQELYIARDSFEVSEMDLLNTFFMHLPGVSQVNGPVWSLCIEWWIYLAFMFFLCIIYTKTLFFKFVFSVLMLGMFKVSYDIYGGRSIFYIAVWCIGALYTLYIRMASDRLMLSRIFACMFFLIYIFAFGLEGLLVGSSDWRHYGFLQVFIALAFLDALTTINLGSFFRWVGGFSYSLYILHFPLFLFLFSLSHSYFINGFFAFSISLIAFVFAIGVAFFSSKLTENRIYYRNLLRSKTL